MLTCHAATSASLSPPSGSLPDPFCGRLLGPPPADQHWWDSLLFAGPLVVRTGPEQAARVGGKAWRMYYHGRDTEEWGVGVCAQSGTPFGRVGMAADVLPWEGHRGVGQGDVCAAGHSVWASGDGCQQRWDHVGEGCVCDYESGVCVTIAGVRRSGASGCIVALYLVEPYPGPLPGGAVFDPSDDPSAFDSVHVGCSDVLLLPDGKWLMLYYAGGLDPGRFPAWPTGKTALGARMRCGVAMSADGVTWQRAKAPFLDVGDVGSWDELAVSWPRLTVLSTWHSNTGAFAGAPHNLSKWEGRTSEGADGGEGGGEHTERATAKDAVHSSFADMAVADRLLTYQSVGDPHAPGHAHVGEDGEVDRVPESLPQYCYTIGSAAFDPSTKAWTKKGSCIRRGPLGAWDEAGANRRHVLPLAAFGPKAVQKWEQEQRVQQQEQRGQQGGMNEDSGAAGEGSIPPMLLMFYEGARYNGTYSIGLAYSADGGETWEKARHVGPEPGGPILQPRFGEEVWDNLLVGTPHLVVMGEGGEGKIEGVGEGKREGEVGNGRILMYYTGVGEVSGRGRVRGIGAAVWEGGETGDLSKWRRLFVD
ncbi:unnamed protein product [Closterium sp. Naga37s-1]|nr:unnamed protein product [Closterium sp. Naga37s-1]